MFPVTLAVKMKGFALVGGRELGVESDRASISRFSRCGFRLAKVLTRPQSLCSWWVQLDGPSCLSGRSRCGFRIMLLSDAHISKIARCGAPAAFACGYPDEASRLTDPRRSLLNLANHC